MTVKELKEKLKTMPDNATIGYWDGDYSIENPCPAYDIFYDEKRDMVIVSDD